jgi:hypothetical protein
VYFVPCGIFCESLYKISRFDMLQQENLATLLTRAAATILLFSSTAQAFEQKCGCRDMNCFTLRRVQLVLIITSSERVPSIFDDVFG